MKGRVMKTERIGYFISDHS